MLLAYDDPLPAPPTRVLIAGVTGSGKTTLAKRVEDSFSLRRVELDALFHGPEWTPRPTFLEDVRAFAAEESWVTEWQYTSKGTDAVLAPRADLVLWLDYPYRVVRSRLVRRTVTRSVLRTPLWNGNRERPLWRLASKTNPDENILRWQTKTLNVWSERMPLMRERYPHLTLVRFRHPREAEQWITSNAPVR